jgi:SAM-dependent methyltransferase
MTDTAPVIGSDEVADELRDELQGAFRAQLMRAFAQLAIADLLADGPRTAADLACSIGADEQMLRSFLGACEDIRLVSAEGSERLALTARGRQFQTGAELAVHAKWLLGPGTSRTYEHIADAVRAGTSAADALGTHPYQHFAANPEEGYAFDEVMNAFTGICVPALLSTFDFSGAGRIVDIGGGKGTLLAGVLAGTPNATGVLYEAPRLVELARKELAGTVAEDVAERIEFVEGDFLSSVPPGGDIYLLKSVICDWGDDEVERLLRNAHEAMGPGSRLLIIEWFGPEAPDATPQSHARDFFLRAAFGGRLRSWQHLATALVTSGFTIKSVVPAFAPPPSSWSLIVAAP